MDTDETQWLGQWVPVVLAARDEFVLRASARKKVYVETNYRLTYLARALRDAFPASRFIHLHRDPYAVIRSGMRRGAYMPGKEWYVGRIRPHPDDPVAAQWDGLSTLEKEAWRWARINAEAMAFLAELPAARKLELPSAKLFSGAEDVCEEVFSFAGAKRPAMKKIGQVLGMRKNAQDHYQDTKMFNWGKERREVVQPFIEEIAHKLGYEV